MLFLLSPQLFGDLWELEVTPTTVDQASVSFPQGVTIAEVSSTQTS